MNTLYDVVVLGGGPAGLTAALYLARARYRVIVVEKERFGGQIAITDEVVNYPGVEKTTGAKLGATMREQAEKFGAEFISAEVTSLDCSGDVKKVHLAGRTLECFGIVLATGAHPRRIGFKGEAEFQGRGVAYCATCDGEFFAGKDIFVVGGGFAAAEEAVFLTRYARHVTILIRKADFSCARTVADTARSHDKITVLCNTEIEEASGDTALRRLRYRNTLTGETTEYRAPDGDTFGLFVFAGYEPATALVRGVAELDGQGYVVVDRSQRTSVEGLYAAGDVCAKTLRQVVTAVADGAVAATELEKYASAMQEKTGRVPPPPEPAAADACAAGAGACAVKPGVEVGDAGGTLTGEMREQLVALVGRMARPLVLRLSLDDRPISGELRGVMEELAGLTDKLSVEVASSEVADAMPPCVRIFLADGTDTGIAFHGVPGGHEFTSFALALYNASGPGQPLEPGQAEAIRAIDASVRIQILVTLSCTMCPDTVKAAQRMAVENPRISAEVYDANHFPDLRNKYNAMSVPCIIINGEVAAFGRKTMSEMLELAGAAARRGE